MNLNGQTLTVEAPFLSPTRTGLGAADGTAASGTIVNASGSTAGSLVIAGVGIGNEMVTLNGSGPNATGALQAINAPSTLSGPVVSRPTPSSILRSI